MKSKIKILLKIVIILILLTLTFTTYQQGKDSNCNKCSVEFKNIKVSGVHLQEPIIFKEKMQELYFSFINNKCKIKWDRSGGYYK